jgi:arylsulfatase A
MNLVKVLVMAFVVSVMFVGGHAAEKGTPNIVVILADDFGWGSVGCYGGAGLKTPNLDRLAKEGRKFMNGYATGSVCSPTRYALMTGRYYWRTDVKDGKVLSGEGSLHIETNRVTLASLVKTKGYRTAAIGKWHLGLGTNTKVDWNAPLSPGPRAIGFDYFFGLGANIGNPPGYFLENEQVLTNSGAIQIQDNPDKVMQVTTEKAVSWINTNHASPFFLYFTPVAVHEPVTPSAQFTGSSFGKYGDFIHELDWSVGRILDTLDKHGIAKNTLVIFTSDNGGVAREQNPTAGAAMKVGLKINGHLRGGKHDIYEGGFREPFMVRWPERVPAGSTSEDIVSVSDVLATLAGILKVPVPSGNAEDSMDVSSSFFGVGQAARTSIVLQDASAYYAVRRGPWKLIERENPPVFKPRNQKTARTAAQHQKGSGKDELYNLETDAGETNNVALKHPNVVKQLRTLLAETRDQTAVR